MLTAIPPAGPSPWPYQICLIKVAEPDELFNANPREGWSVPEPWGRWALGTESHAHWAVPLLKDYELLIDVFPNWIEGRTQEITLLINDQELAVLTFAEDAPLSETIHIPAELLDEGWNKITFLSEYAISPAETTDGLNPDTRPFSFGVSKLILRPSTPFP